MSERFCSQVVPFKIQRSQIRTVLRNNRQHLLVDVTPQSDPPQLWHPPKERTNYPHRFRNVKLLIVAVKVQHLQLGKAQLTKRQKEVVPLEEHGKFAQLLAKVGVHLERSFRIAVHVEAGDVWRHDPEVDLVQLQAAVVLQV
uniref:(northern house mosquito) hypothetical protein n=1 Tax=Culex pipiens TaxID=7175 RepID=A0A8D8HNW2_CULPI